MKSNAEIYDPAPGERGSGAEKHAGVPQPAERSEPYHVSDAEVLHALLSTLPDRVYFKDLNSRFLRLNEALFRALGLKDASEAIGKTDFDFFTPEHALPAYEQEREIIRTGEPLLNIEEKETYADGRVSWVSTTKMPFRIADGTIIGTFGISRDITEAKVTEQALHENLTMFRAVFDGSNDGIMLVHNQKFIDCNARAAALFGCEKKDLINKTPVCFSPPFQPDGRASSEAVEAFAKKVLETGHAQFEWMHRNANGTDFPTEVTLSTFEFLGRKIIHGTVHDLTQRKKAELERQELEARLQLTSKLEAVGALAAGVAHEVNTPTQFIADNIRFLVEGFSNLSAMVASYRECIKSVAAKADSAEAVRAVTLAENKLELDYMLSEIPRCLDQSLDGLRRIAKIVGSLKEFSHPGDGNKELADLNRAIETTVSVSRHEWKYVADVVTDLDPHLPRVPCVVDAINQVFLNLIINASHAIDDANKIKGTTKGTITLRTRLDGANAIVEVEDTGTGIPEAARARIFEPFFTTKPAGKGTGQGLAIVQAVVVKKHHGSVRFVTETGKGTTFILSLPLNPTPACATNPLLT